MDCALSSIRKICAHEHTQNKNILSIYTTLDRQASRTRDRSKVHIKFTYWWALFRADPGPHLCLSWVELNEDCQSTVWALKYLIQTYVCGTRDRLRVHVKFTYWRALFRPELNLSVDWNIGEIELELKNNIEEVPVKPVKIAESNGE